MAMACRRVARANLYGHQHDAVDRRHAGVAHHFHHHDSPQTHAVKIDNPLPPPPNFVPPPPPEVIDLTIDFDGTLAWNKTPVDRPTLQGYISQEAVKTPQPEVHISVDKFAKYEKVAQTLADLQKPRLEEDRFRQQQFVLIITIRRVLRRVSPLTRLLFDGRSKTNSKFRLRGSPMTHSTRNIGHKLLLGLVLAACLTGRDAGFAGG